MRAVSGPPVATNRPPGLKAILRAPPGTKIVFRAPVRASTIHISPVTSSGRIPRTEPDPAATATRPSSATAPPAYPVRTRQVRASGAVEVCACSPLPAPDACLASSPDQKDRLAAWAEQVPLQRRADAYDVATLARACVEDRGRRRPARRSARAARRARSGQP